MRIFKSAFAKLLLVTIISTLFTFQALAENTTNFSDIDDNEIYKDAIQFLYDSKIVKGYDDGTFKPQNTINRAEMVKIIAEAKLKLNNLPSDFLVNYSNQKCFSDVPVNEWFTKYVCYGKEQGWIVGYENGKYFHPGNTITFVEALKITLEGFDLSYIEMPPVWYKGVVEAASLGNYIPFDVYDFNVGFRRNQMADLITRILKHKESQESLNNYLGERVMINVTYETIEQGLDLSISQFEEKEEPKEEPKEDPKITNPGSPFVYINYASMDDSSFPITIFDPMNDGGKSITSYHIYDVMNLEPKLFKILYKEGNFSNIFELNGLTKDKDVAFVVKAINEDGLESNSGDIINLIVSKSAGVNYSVKFAEMTTPDAPVVSIIDQTSDHITLNIGHTSKATVEYYAIEILEGENYVPYKILRTSDFASFDDFKNGGPITLSGLTTDKSYDMRIRAITTERKWSKEEIILKFVAAKNGFNFIQKQ